MIIFHSLPSIEQLFYNLQQYDPRYGGYVFSHFTLFGQVQLGSTLNVLPKAEFIPEEVRPYMTESAFDYYYWIQLETDIETFLAKMDFLRLEYLYGPSMMVAIQIDESPYKTSVVESLMGYIRTFYGLDTKLVLSQEDLMDPDFFSYSGFSTEGLCRLSDDLTKAEILKGGAMG